MQGNRRVSQTAFATAQFWAAAGFENAELFSSRRGWISHQFLRVGQLIGRPFLPASAYSFDQYVMARHRAIEHLVDQYQPDSVIEIAAGLSPRGLTYTSRSPALRYLEIDLPEMVAEKNKRLKNSGKPLPDNLQLLAADALADDFAERILGHALFKVQPKRLLVISEGLLDYLDAEQKNQLWSSIKTLLSAVSDSQYVFECWPLERLKRSPSFAAGITGLELLTGQRMNSRLLPDSQTILRLATKSGLPNTALIPVSEYAPAFLNLDSESSPWQLYRAG